MLDTLKNHGKRWTEEEEERLKEMARQNRGWDEISDELCRSPMACSSRYWKITESDIDRIKVNDHMGFQRSTGDKQSCSHCGRSMKGDYGLSITKKIPGRYGFGKPTRYNVWIHARCLRGFLKTIEGAMEEHEEKLRSEIISEVVEELSSE